MLLKALKTLSAAMLTAAGLAGGPALAAGTTPLSLVQQFGATGTPLSQCLLYFFVAGTVATPQNAFSDFGLTTPLPNPVTCDQSGRVPQHWLADGLIHIRLTDSSGIVQVDTTMQVLGPSSGGGGGGGTVDPTAILSTGDEKVRYGTGAIAGFVRENGLTIGNATSGATERANADTQALFIYLYNTDPNLVVSGGRTGNALTDYNAAKTIAVPDMRGRVNGFLADMGNTATSVLTNTYALCNSSVTTLGSTCGAQNHTMSLGETAIGITSAGTITVFPDGNSSHFVPENLVGANWQPNNLASIGGGTGLISPYFNGNNAQLGQTNSFTGSGTLTANNVGGQPHSIVNPMMLKTSYIKL